MVQGLSFRYPCGPNSQISRLGTPKRAQTLAHTLHIGRFSFYQDKTGAQRATTKKRRRQKSVSSDELLATLVQAFDSRQAYVLENLVIVDNLSRALRRWFKHSGLIEHLDRAIAVIECAIHRLLKISISEYEHEWVPTENRGQWEPRNSLR